MHSGRVAEPKSTARRWHCVDGKQVVINIPEMAHNNNYMEQTQYQYWCRHRQVANHTATDGDGALDLGSYSRHTHISSMLRR